MISKIKIMTNQIRQIMKGAKEKITIYDLEEKKDDEQQKNLRLNWKHCCYWQFAAHC